MMGNVIDSPNISWVVVDVVVLVCVCGAAQLYVAPPDRLCDESKDKLKLFRLGMRGTKNKGVG